MILKAAVLCVTVCALLDAGVSVVTPRNMAPPIGPYSPGVVAGDYLYVSGQGAKRQDGSLPSTFDDQVRQALENVKAVVESAGLSMKNVVYTKVFLDDMAHFDAMNSLYAEYFSGAPPARATIGVAALPGSTPVEINAIAYRDASRIKAVALRGRPVDEPVSPGILTPDRLFISATPEKDVDAALDGMKEVVEAAGLNLANVVFVNPYLTKKIPNKVMNASYAKRFEFGNTPGRATIEVTSLPRGAEMEFTGVAVRELAKRQAIRPKNMPPSPTASPCVFANDTLYCSAKSGFIPGVNGGVFTPDVGLQLRQTMRNLLDNLEEAGLTFKDVVSTEIYLDNLADFGTINRIYSKYFPDLYPARTTVQQIAPGDRTKKNGDEYPEVEQISLIAVKPNSK